MVWAWREYPTSPNCCAGRSFLVPIRRRSRLVAAMHLLVEAYELSMGAST
jgi:hypothetical protein